MSVSRFGRVHYVGRVLEGCTTFLEGRPRRFHARFFMADAVHAKGEIKSNGELLDIRWVPLVEAAALPIPSITGQVIEEVINLISHPSLLLKDRTIPVYQRRNGQDTYRRE